MSDVDRFIGAFTEFRKWEETEHVAIKKDLSEIKQDIKDLNQFRWRVYGVASLVALLVSTFGTALVRGIFGI